jgi:hypothetical protein
MQSEEVDLEFNTSEHLFTKNVIEMRMLWLDLRQRTRETNSFSTPSRQCYAAPLMLLLLFSNTMPATAAEWKPVADLNSKSKLFLPSDTIRVNAPSKFPKPTRLLGPDAVVVVEPTFGTHRPDHDAILAYAEGYKLSYYMQFLETLTLTGYRGDVVLAIAEPRIIRPDVVEYLQTYTNQGINKPNVVIYQQELKCDARDGEVTNQRQLVKTGDTDIFQMCQLSEVYGWKDEAGKIRKTASDPREGRVVATLRYEWYWIWSIRYQPHAWIMLIDARDSYFQSDPFDGLPREESPASARPDGLLYLFGENAEATRLGKSRKNLKWIQNGYGAATLEAVSDKPTICSGSTMGEQVAVETYLRAMVNEHDECDVKMTGSDQGFHNYLYYSSKLTNSDTIRRITVWEQGKGIINNLGALRTQTLEEWGIYDPVQHGVYQWDGASLSPVVHQWDRDKALHGYLYGQLHREWTQQWIVYQQKQQIENKQPDE